MIYCIFFCTFFHICHICLGYIFGHTLKRFSVHSTVFAATPRNYPSQSIGKTWVPITWAQLLIIKSHNYKLFSERDLRPDEIYFPRDFCYNQETPGLALPRPLPLRAYSNVFNLVLTVQEPSQACATWISLHRDTPHHLQHVQICSLWSMNCRQASSWHSTECILVTTCFMCFLHTICPILVSINKLACDFVLA